MGSPRFFALVLVTLVTASSAAAQNAPPDVVQLTNGGMLRGTIVENIPGDHVTIQLVTGEVRHFPAAEVRSAGPATPVIEAPPAVPPAPQYATPPPGYQQPPALDPNLITLHVTSTAPGVTLQRLTGTANISVWTGRGMGYGVIDNFEPICTAPCAIQIPRGTYILGLSQGEGRPRRADHSLFIAARSTDVALEYESREVWRNVGWVIFAAATAGYIGAMLYGLTVDGNTFLTVLEVATVAYVALLIPFLIMSSLNDHADIRQAATAPPSGQF